MRRAALVPALALLAVLAAPGGPAATGRSQPDAGGTTNITLVSAASPDYPADPYPLTVCLDGSATVLEVGGQADVETSAGQHVADLYLNDATPCGSPPDATVTFTAGAGEVVGVVAGWDTLFTYVLDESCMDAGTGRIQLANGADFPTAADYYAVSESTGDAVLLAADVLPGTSVVVPDVPVGPYAIRAYTPGTPDPETTAPIAIFGSISIDEGYQVQTFLSGSSSGDNLLGNFTFEQGPLVCQAESEPTPSTTPATSSTTTPVPSGTAPAATPVSGTAAYTG